MRPASGFRYPAGGTVIARNGIEIRQTDDVRSPRAGNDGSRVIYGRENRLGRTRPDVSLRTAAAASRGARANNFAENPRRRYGGPVRDDLSTNHKRPVYGSSVDRVVLRTLSGVVCARKRQPTATTFGRVGFLFVYRARRLSVHPEDVLHGLPVKIIESSSASC